MLSGFVLSSSTILNAIGATGLSFVSMRSSILEAISESCLFGPPY